MVSIVILSTMNIRRLLRNSTRQLSKVCIGLGAASIIQGSYFITRYRFNHAEAPHPQSPSRGGVVMKKSLHRWSNVTTKAMAGEEGEKELPPLKIFVVGDSLACGCGIAKSSTPILPESIARHLARQLGRSVQWSCVGKPGASTKGIMQMLQKWSSKGKDDEDTGTGADDYDVVVVLAGMNDMKDILLPFLAYETVDSSFGDGLKKIFGLLKSKLRLQKTKHATISLVRDELEMYSEQEQRQHQHQQDEQVQNQSRSLIVLPALPTNAIPLLSYPPIGLFLNTIISYMDSVKQELSQEYSKHLLFVEAPSQSLIQSIEQGTSKLCIDDDKTDDSKHALIAFHDIKLDVKRNIERLMREHTTYFEYNADCEAEVECEQALFSNLRPHIPELGSTLVSYDLMHPNEKGYDYWGRHIAEAIVDEWKRTRME